MGEYEYEFKRFIGKPLPLKMLGYLSVEEMAENMTDVISMIRLSCGTIMLQAVPDENTLELANEIQNQRYEIQGRGIQFWYDGHVKTKEQCREDSKDSRIPQEDHEESRGYGGNH